VLQLRAGDSGFRGGRIHPLQRFPEQARFLQWLVHGMGQETRRATGTGTGTGSETVNH
jgi:hypothetical protein